MASFRLRCTFFKFIFTLCYVMLFCFCLYVWVFGPKLSKCEMSFSRFRIYLSSFIAQTDEYRVRHLYIYCRQFKIESRHLFEVVEACNEENLFFSFISALLPVFLFSFQIVNKGTNTNFHLNFVLLISFPSPSS